MKVKIALIDDHRIFAETLANVLSQLEFVAAVEIFNTAVSYLEQAAATNADIIVSDIMMPEMTGLELLTRVRQQDAHVRFLFLSSLVEGQIIRNAIKQGASGYMSKGAPLSEFSAALQAIYEGEQYIGNDVKNNLISSALSEDHINYELSPQQKEVLKQICAGRTVKEIAFDMKLSVNTVQTYYRAIMKKFKVNRTVDLILVAIQQGLVSPPVKQSR